VTAARPRRAVGRLRRAAATIESPADAALAVRMLGWALVLPVLKTVAPLRTLVRLMSTGGGRRAPRDTEAERRIGSLARLSHRAAGAGRRDNCLERSLIAYRYLCAANADPVLVVGARDGPSGVEGHVWITVDGEPVQDNGEEIRQYAPVTAFDADGRIGPVPATTVL
jgi:hypothetical protein